MKKGIFAVLATLMVVLGSTVMPAYADHWGYYRHGYYGGYHHDHDIGARLGFGLAGLGIGLGLGALGGALNNDRYYYEDTYPRRVNVYTQPSYYGYTGDYWY